VKFDEQVFDSATDAVKEVTGIRNITGGDDIISDDMRLLASEDENEFTEVSKAAPPVDAQKSDNHAGDVKDQEVKEVEEIRRYPLRNRTQTPAWNLSAHATHTPDSATFSSALASTNKDKWLEAIDKEVSALEDADTWTVDQHQPGMNILRSHLVLNAKGDTVGAIIKYKARLVAGEDAQDMVSTSISRTHPSPISLSFVSSSASLPVRTMKCTAWKSRTRSCGPHWQESCMCLHQRLWLIDSGPKS
jgi:hypothetical protein